MTRAREPGSHPPAGGERGVALVMALLVLLVMALLAAVLMMSISVNRKVAGHDLRREGAQVRASIGVALQAAALDDQLNSWEHMDLQTALQSLVRTSQPAPPYWKEKSSPPGLLML